MGSRNAGQGIHGKPYEGHESLISWLRHHAFRAGMSEADFWKSTAFAVIQAFHASEENMSRLAYRTAFYQRLKWKHWPKAENEIFGKAVNVKKQMTVADQRAMFKFMTAALPSSKGKH